MLYVVDDRPSTSGGVAHRAQGNARSVSRSCSRLSRGTFTSVKDLIGAIETYIDAWNERGDLHLDKGALHS
jgi:hypothetical protein